MSERRQLLDSLNTILGCEKITTALNRMGLRRRSAELLEDSFIELAARLTPTLSVEIGAHEADFSHRMQETLPDLRSLAFEANPDVARWFAPRSTGLDYRHLAISDRDGSVQLNIPRLARRPGSRRKIKIASLRKRSSAEFRYRVVDVPANRLDTALDGIDRSRSFVWIDAEGAQSEILEGGAETFSVAIAVYIELERSAAWAGQPLAGAVVAHLARHGLEMVMLDNIARTQFNAVFVRRRSDVLGSALDVGKGYLENIRRLVESP